MPVIQKLPKKRTNSINRVNRQKVYNTSTWKNIRASYNVAPTLRTMPIE